jgi:hypothetical protein
VVAGLERCDARSNFLHDAGAFMAENGRECTFRVGTGAGEFIGVTDAGGLDLNEDLAFLRSFEIYLDHFQWLAGFKCDRSPCLHGCSLPGPNARSEIATFITISDLAGFGSEHGNGPE